MFIQANAKWFTYISLNSGYNHKMCEMCETTSVLGLRKLRLERFINLPKITELLSDKSWDLNLCRIPLKYLLLHSTASENKEPVLRMLGLIPDHEITSRLKLWLEL